MKNLKTELIMPLKNISSTGFFVIIFFKIILLAVFTSDYSLNLFSPFISIFSEGNLNPWQYYYETGLNLDAFPYHSLMLYLLTPSMLIIQFLHIENILISNLIFKLPLFVADIVILYTFLRLFPSKKKKIVFYYFYNPIIIYAIYIHSQLDIIPMALLMLGIYFLNNDRLRTSSLLVGLALATKFHVLVALPLLLFYLQKKYNFKEVIIYFSISIGVLFFFDLPYIFSEGFKQMVLFNPKQSLLFDSYINIGKLELLLPIASIILVYLHFFNQKKVNQDLLFFYFGVLFTATIFFIYPAPAWYVWLVPFVSIYFINTDNEIKTRLFYFVLSATYLFFFIFFYQPDYKDILFLGNEINFKIENENFSNISFTVLLSMLITVMYAFYKYGIQSNSIYKKQSNLTIGIGGDSGAGKSTLLDHFSQLLGNRLLMIEGDGEHKWERGDKNWSKYTHLDPKANFIHKQAEVIHDLKLNNSIYRSDYDHSVGKFTAPAKVEPKEFIAISGLHPFYLPKQRKNIDLKIYIATADNLRKHWKILRDIEKRSYNAEKILDQIDTRNNDGAKYIYPQKEFADLIIEYFSPDEIIIGDADQQINLGLKITVDANLHLEEILNILGSEFLWDYNEDLRTQFVIFKQEPNVDFKSLANKYISNINEIIISEAKWLKGYNGLVQLISFMMISEKLKEV
jgi:uridine kinase